MSTVTVYVLKKMIRSKRKIRSENTFISPVSSHTNEKVMVFFLAIAHCDP